MGAPDGNRDRGAGNRRGRVAPPSDEAPPPIDVCEGGHVSGGDAGPFSGPRGHSGNHGIGHPSALSGGISRPRRDPSLAAHA